jgi:hypothetical protein
MRASKCGYLDVAKLLVDRGAEIDAEDIVSLNRMMEGQSVNLVRLTFENDSVRREKEEEKSWCVCGSISSPFLLLLLFISSSKPCCSTAFRFVLLFIF